MVGDADQTSQLVEAILEACDRCTALRITGSGSKAFLTQPSAVGHRTNTGRLLSIAEHCGITEYRPEELVITARAGTTLKELELQLARKGQMLGFEPPRFSGSGTLGGAIASGLSGPGRPWYGALRDALLGVEMINGRGEFLRFGGQVMKNVAGFDISRLQAGAFGTLGVVLSASIRVLPKPEVAQSLRFELDAEAAGRKLRIWARLPLPITATCHVDNQLSIRLAGVEVAVRWAQKQIGGESFEGDVFWTQVRNHEVDFFRKDAVEQQDTLWRLSLPPDTQLTSYPTLSEWAGALRWVRSDGSMADWAREHGGYALPFDGDYGVQSFSRFDHGLNKRIKEAFDPVGILNPMAGLFADAN